MPGASDREHSIEHLLRRGLRTAPPPPTVACPDAETLAAWADRTLSASQTAQVALHLSDCARCQAVMAVFTRTEPTMVKSAAQARWLQWVVPIGVGSIATVVLLIAAWPRATPRPASQTAARLESPASPVPSSQPQAAPETSRQRQAAREVSLPKAQPAPVSPPEKSEAPRRSAAANSPAASTSPSAPSPQTDAVSALEKPSAGSTSSTGVARGITPAATTAARADQSVALRSLPPVVSEFEGTDQKMGARLVAAGSQGRAAAGPAGAAPSIAVRWRILPSGDVERSLRGSTTWDRIAIDPPAFIYAGDAPTFRICWLVGRGGVVLRTTDGLHFERLNVPNAADLVSVRAVDADRATVTTTDGRTFATADGGLTWQAPLQDFPASPF